MHACLLAGKEGARSFSALPAPAGFVVAQGRSSTEQRANVYCRGRRPERCCTQVRVSLKPDGTKTGADPEAHGPAGAHTAPQGSMAGGPRGSSGATGVLSLPRLWFTPRARRVCGCPPGSPQPCAGRLWGMLSLQHQSRSPSDDRSRHPPDVPMREGLAHSKRQLCMRFSSFQLTLLPSAPIP